VATIPITKRGAEKLKAELHKLRRLIAPGSSTPSPRRALRVTSAKTLNTKSPKIARDSSKGAFRRSKASCLRARSLILLSWMRVVG